MDYIAQMNIIERNNVVVRGSGNETILFAHGFGCDSNMWRLVTPAFEGCYRTAVFDHVGSGKSDLKAYSCEKYSMLDGYADDVIEIVEALTVPKIIFVGHSVSSMIGLIAAKKRPDLFKSIVMVGPSPCYIDGDGYVGGFTMNQLEELMDFLDSNHLGWSGAMAPVIMQNPDRPERSSAMPGKRSRVLPVALREATSSGRIAPSARRRLKSCGPCRARQPTRP
jgi:sigma-B regulation protein RsbQ